LVSDSRGGSRDFRGGSYRVVDNLAEELNLSPGQILRAWVADPLPDYPQRIFIAIKGTRTVARTRLDVEQGDELMVRVKSVGPPIELKLFRPEDARQQVDETQLKNCLEAMEFSPTDELLEVARFLMEQHVPLTPDTVSDTLECWEQLRGDDQLDPDGVDAFRFLTSRNLPLNSRLLELLKSLPFEGPNENAWSDLTGGGNSATEVWNMDWREQVRKLGIDLVKQIGKWPYTASKTIHVQILRKMKQGEVTPELKQKLAQLLALGLVGASGPKTWVILPLREGGTTRLLTMVVESIPGERTRTVHARMEFTTGGKIGLFLVLAPGEWNVKLYCSEKKTAERVREDISDLKNSLKATDREVTIEVSQDPPERLNPFSTEDSIRDTGPDQSGKVDFTA